MHWTLESGTWSPDQLWGNKAWLKSKWPVSLHLTNMPTVATALILPYSICRQHALWCLCGDRSPCWAAALSQEQKQMLGVSLLPLALKVGWKDPGNVAGDWQPWAAACAMVTGSHLPSGWSCGSSADSPCQRRNCPEGRCCCCCSLLDKENLIQKPNNCSGKSDQGLKAP